MGTGHSAPRYEMWKAVAGALGPMPHRFIAVDVSLDVPGAKVVGAGQVACALRELTSGVDDIRVAWADGFAVATWPVAGATGRPWVVCRLEVCDGRIRAITAQRYD